MKLYKELSPQEKKEFRQWARENYEPYSPINGTWHWVIQTECVKINKEHELSTDIQVLENQLPLIIEENVNPL